MIETPRPTHRMMTLQPLHLNQIVILEISEVHYLRNVLRCKEGTNIRIFNSVHGEFLATIQQLDKRQGKVLLNKHLNNARTLTPLTLALATIKPEKFLDAVDMATQLGVTHIVPIIFSRSNYSTINHEKIIKRLHSATEQSERFALPIIDEVISFTDFIKHNSQQTILYANERLAKITSQNWPQDLSQNLICVVGPEGGFTDMELELLHKMDNAYPVSLGQTILRAETASTALLSYIQLNRIK